MPITFSGQLSLAGQISLIPAPNTVLLAHFNENLEDNTGRHTLTLGSAGTLATSQKQFGSGSFEGIDTGAPAASQSFVSTPASADFNFGSSSFTVELWLRFKSIATVQAPIAVYTNTGNQRSWFIQWTTTTLRFAYSTNGISSVIATDPAWSPAIDTWYHIAVDRDTNNDVTTYIDGSVVATANIGAASFFAGSSPFFIGKLTSQPFDDQSFNGFIDEVRITKDLARYAGNAFTVPTAPFKFPG